MERATILSSLAASGADATPQRLTELAAELDLPAADLFVVAGHPVRTELLPPERGARVMRQFAYRVSYCDHSQLAARRHSSAHGPTAVDVIQSPERSSRPTVQGAGRCGFGVPSLFMCARCQISFHR
ncbi:MULTISPECIES: hypothetical protein [unclassified Streptomyces]|uniref:hypothetical protein n=1 Tax=unclassified Streptomyces TaxID=2593676 RepID=UPI001651A4A9|nr:MULTISPECIES: hypothetical protein [unclassified Streptomyces]